MYKASLHVALRIKEIFELQTLSLVLFADKGSMHQLHNANNGLRGISLRVQIESLLLIKQLEKILSEFIG